jgi:hypothetical protein
LDFLDLFQPEGVTTICTARKARKDCRPPYRYIYAVFPSHRQTHNRRPQRRRAPDSPALPQTLRQPGKDKPWRYAPHLHRLKRQRASRPRVFPVKRTAILPCMPVLSPSSRVFPRLKVQKTHCCG